PARSEVRDPTGPPDPGPRTSKSLALAARSRMRLTPATTRRAGIAEDFLQDGIAEASTGRSRHPAVARAAAASSAIPWQTDTYRRKAGDRPDQGGHPPRRRAAHFRYWGHGDARETPLATPPALPCASLDRLRPPRRRLAGLDRPQRPSP